MKILTIPFSKGGLGKADGAEKGPEAVFNSLSSIYCNESGKETKFERVDVPVDPTNFVQTHLNIAEAVKNDNFIMLGGDHSVTHAVLKQLATQELGVVIFDAHADMMQPFSPPTHENFVRMLIEENIIPADKIILVGLRSWDKEEIKFLRENKIRYFTMKNIITSGIENVCDEVMAQARVWPSLYISIDIDVVDPAFAPATGYPEPGGLSSRDLIYFIQRMRLLKNLKAADIVEIVPEKDVNNITVRLGAKLVSEISEAFST